MSILIVSDTNLRFLKSVLMHDYEVKSSHASELIAALCGTKSYAALKEKLKIFQYSPAVRINTEKFEERNVELGYDRSSGEWLRFSFTSLHLPDRPWLMHNTAQKYMRNDWYEHCQRNSIPFITIHKKNKYCYLQWDYISIDTKFEGHLLGEQGDELGRILFRLYKLNAHGNEPKSFFDGTAFCGGVIKLSEISARMIANDFFMELTPWKLDYPSPHSHSIVPGGLLV
jgi:hypothetical protein